MTELVSSLAGRAGAMRLAFDRTFAEPVCFDTAAMDDLLAIRIGSEACALRLADITGLFVDKQVTRVPGRNPALLGIAGFRGAIIPVYDLPKLLGHAALVTPHWLVTAAAAPIALAFGAYEGHLRVTRDAIVPPPNGATRKFIGEFVQARNDLRALVNMPSVLETLGDKSQD